MADDTLTPKDVAEQIRTAERAFHDEPRPWWLVSLRVLLDENNKNADLREYADEAARQCFTAEEILDARIKDLDDLREQLRRLTNTLREYARHKTTCPLASQPFLKRFRCDCGFERALAEMGESDE